mgnify:CR=1 FL=1
MDHGMTREPGRCFASWQSCEQHEKHQRAISESAVAASTYLLPSLRVSQILTNLLTYQDNSY